MSAPAKPRRLEDAGFEPARTTHHRWRRGMRGDCACESCGSLGRPCTAATAARPVRARCGREDQVAAERQLFAERVVGGFGVARKSAASPMLPRTCIQWYG